MMDTAKVDIRKLQLLNDRVNQCIDALTQVRLSVHGLSHSPQVQGQQGIPGAGALGQDPRLSFGWGAGVAANPYMTAGISHSNPFAGASPGLAPGLGVAAVPFGAINPYAILSHSSGESFETLPRPMWADPLLASRIAQTFPYAYVAVPSVVTIY